MREERVIKNLSPYLQGFLVKLLEEMDKARSMGDVYNYAESLKMFYHTLPEDVRGDIAARMKSVLGDGEINVSETGTPDELLVKLEGYCKRYMGEYEQFAKRRSKEAFCALQMKRYLDIYYSHMLAVTHSHNIFVYYTRPFLVGGNIAVPD